MSEQVSAAVIGSGGREYELARQLVKEYQTVYVLGGNAGTEMLPGIENIVVSSTEDAARFVDERRVGFTVVGPEQYLVDGLADRIRANGQTVFGPTAEAARLEASKVFATRFMQGTGIPHPQSLVFENMDEALGWARSADPEDYVIKADGLAAGKGVVLPDTKEEAQAVIGGMMSGKMFGDAGRQIVIQERLHGPEVSVFAVTDGHHFSLLPASQDHKRLLDGDKGPNTGGMGAYAPVPEAIMSRRQWEQTEAIVARTIQGMEKKGHPYQGVLFMGLMLAEEYDGNPVVIEYNVRFGDPEAQVVLPVAESQIRKEPYIAADTIAGLLRTAAEGRLVNLPLRPDIGKTALTVCLAGEGYPASKYTDAPRIVYGLDREYDDVIIHQAATQRSTDRQVVSGGGRILYATGIGETVDEAAKRAYDSLGPFAVHTVGGHWRRDIGWQVREGWRE